MGEPRRLQEIAEFRGVAAQGLDPETAQPFTSSARMLEVYLTRQQPSASELLMGVFPGAGQIFEQRGVAVPPTTAYDPLRDAELMASVDQLARTFNAMLARLETALETQRPVRR